MKKKILIATALVILAAAIGLLVRRATVAGAAPAFRFVTIERGNIQSKVSATGTLNAVTTVSVGTQVSGQISDLSADFNDHVKKGQLLARIDPTLAQQAVTDALANLQKAEAEGLLSQLDYKRNQELTAGGLVARSAYETSQSSLDVARANVKSAEVALQRAKQNLSYTNIYAPIDGVVVERNVQQGQTVAASLSAPQLFLIANDLAHMQILAQVSESDIAQIEQGQNVDFTVQALPNRKFQGAVRQVRLQSTTSDNVVNYTVVISVDNPEGKLLPGMTARVDFLTNAATNVLTVSNAALRFRPPATAAPSSSTVAPNSSTVTPASRRSAGTPRGSTGTLYSLDAQGKLTAASVRTGITDGMVTEVQGQDIKEGMKVVAGTVTATQSTQTAATPLTATQQRGRGGL
jgi:HlyD family secretion protein